MRSIDFLSFQKKSVHQQRTICYVTSIFLLFVIFITTQVYTHYLLRQMQALNRNIEAPLALTPVKNSSTTNNLRDYLQQLREISKILPKLSFIQRINFYPHKTILHIISDNTVVNLAFLSTLKNLFTVENVSLSTHPTQALNVTLEPIH